MHLGGLPVEDDVSPGVWIADGRTGRPGTVAGLVPSVFEAYARVLHPAYRYAGDDDLPVRWADVAAHNGTVVHPQAQWAALTGGLEYLSSDSQPPVWDGAPAEGHLPVEAAAALASVLAGRTTTPEHCWFGRSGSAYDGPDLAGAPQLALAGGRDAVLVRGSVRDAVRNLAPEPHEQSANLWWPADRAWCVVTDLDCMSTYVGGTAACIAAVLAEPALEALPARPDDSTAWDRDPVNPPPP
ncbi:hypothetical protein OF117_13470 [Geodermatophilus sp. YIM 151500]|uniref:hypothetical protein n=1 Tax=Geodermatophilus sp. YIM 151500 TaxID=2984531 RepID=UPI0021E43479|nr:hypothetical protein [Geodermatophilus sp. YIM 151500]MCV2490372.1 hypothetical protein [Geodermatophilus sp. YIM 151500]